MTTSWVSIILQNTVVVNWPSSLSSSPLSLPSRMSATGRKRRPWKRPRITHRKKICMFVQFVSSIEGHNDRIKILSLSPSLYSKKLVLDGILQATFFTFLAVTGGLGVSWLTYSSDVMCLGCLLAKEIQSLGKPWRIQWRRRSQRNPGRWWRWVWWCRRWGWPAPCCSGPPPPCGNLFLQNQSTDKWHTKICFSQWIKCASELSI